MKRYEVHWARLTAKLDALSPSDALALRELLIEMYGKP